MKKNIIINALVAITSIVIVLFTAEIIMRFAWQMGGWVERPIYRRSLNPYLRYELVPGAREENRISINSDGFRGPDYPVKKPSGTFRILMLGDSETFSFMLQEKDTLPRQLEDMLNKNSTSMRYEVLNFGVEGYGTFQELEMLEAKGLKYHPDLIILNYVLNDPEPGEYYFDKSFLMRKSALVRWFVFRIKKSMIKTERKKLGINTEIDNYFYYHQPKYLMPVKHAFREMAGISRSLGNKLIIVIFPTSSIMVKDFKENYPYWPLHKLVKNTPSDNIIFVDLIEEFNRLNLTPQDVSINYKYDESHKNPAALSAAAQHIYNILKSNKIIPQ